MKREQLFEKLKETLVELFEVSPDDVVPEARLYEDLDIDSIDAVDLIVKLKEITGKKVDPKAYKEIRTVDDILNALELELQDV